MASENPFHANSAFAMVEFPLGWPSRRSRGYFRNAFQKVFLDASMPSSSR